MEAAGKDEHPRYGVAGPKRNCGCEVGVVGLPMVGEEDELQQLGDSNAPVTAATDVGDMPVGDIGHGVTFI